MSMKKDEFDYILRDASHERTDDLEVSERVKQKTDRKIAGRVSEKNLPNKESIELSLATVCLNLFESIEKRADKMEVHIKCIPRDDAFDRKIVINNHVIQTLEIILLELLSKLAVSSREVMLSTKENNITVSGIYSVLEYLNGLCSEKDGKLIIEKSENALAMAYLKLNECYIREVKEEGRSLIMIGFEAE